MRPARLYASELVAGCLAVLLLLVAWSSMLLAHAGRHSLATVALLTAFGVSIGAAICRRFARVAVELDPAGLAVLAVTGAVAAFMFLPGFPYGVSDKDPGHYVAHGMLISRTGDYAVDYPVLAAVPEYQHYHRDEPLAGVHHQRRDDGTLVPVFYHLSPALLATAHDAFGLPGLVNTGPVVGVLAVLLLVVAVRRVGGLFAGLAAGLLLATNMLVVWQAKYPSAEILAQFLFLGAVAGVVLALSSGARVPALAAGLFTGATYLARPDGLLLVLMAAAIGCVLLAAGRWDARCGYFAAGLAAVLPHAFFHAYHVVRPYTLQQHVPDFPVVLAILTVAVVTALFVGATFGPRLAGALARPALQRPAGVAVVAGAAALLVVGAFRPALFGPVVQHFADGSTLRSYDEQAIPRLAWFLTWPAFGLALAGLAVVALRRWRPEAWAVAIPTLLLLPLYGWQPRVAARLMWWGRRFVPVVVPGVVILVALALGWLATRRSVWSRLVAAAGAAALVVSYASQSAPLRSHREWAGSFSMARRVAETAPPDGVFLWEFSGRMTPLFSGTTLLVHGRQSAMMAREPARRDGYVRLFRAAFPDRPLYVVWSGTRRPPGLADVGLAPVAHFVEQSVTWEQSTTHRPARSQPVRLEYTVWAVAATDAPPARG